MAIVSTRLLTHPLSHLLTPLRGVQSRAATDTWDIWRTPTEAAAAAQSSSSSSDAAVAGGQPPPPEFVEVIIDDDMLAVGAESSSLRRIPAGKEFQLKGNSQNTPFRPGGFEARALLYIAGIACWGTPPPCTPHPLLDCAMLHCTSLYCAVLPSTQVDHITQHLTHCPCPCPARCYCCCWLLVLCCCCSERH